MGAFSPASADSIVSSLGSIQASIDQLAVSVGILSEQGEALISLFSALVDLVEERGVAVSCRPQATHPG